MKKLAIIVVLLSGITLTAQRHEGKRNGMQDLTPQQEATLRTKKMTLELDLNQTQQKEIESMLLANAELRKTKREQWKAKKVDGAKPTKEERFAMQNERLDNKIAHKAEMKKLLTEAQFAKWEKMNDDKRQGHKREGKRKGRS